MGAADRTALVSRIEQLERTGVADVITTANKGQQQQLRVREIRRQWDAVQDLGPRLTELKNQLTALDESVREAFSKKQNLENRKHGHEAELRELRAAIGQMETVQSKLGPIEQRIDIASRVREVIADIRDDLVPLCKESLEERCTHHFREMISAELRLHSIKFDHELQPMLVRGNAQPVYVETLSGAQKRAFGLAFALSFASLANVGLTLMINRVRDVMASYITKMKEFNPTSFADTAASPRRLPFLRDRGVCLTFSYLMIIAALMSAAGAVLIVTGCWAPNLTQPPATP